MLSLRSWFSRKLVYFICKDFFTGYVGLLAFRFSLFSVWLDSCLVAQFWVILSLYLSLYVLFSILFPGFCWKFYFDFYLSDYSKILFCFSSTIDHVSFLYLKFRFIFLIHPSSLSPSLSPFIFLLLSSFLPLPFLFYLLSSFSLTHSYLFIYFSPFHWFCEVRGHRVTNNTLPFCFLVSI